MGLKTETEEFLVETFRKMLYACVADMDHFPPDHNEYGHPFDPAKDTRRGPRDMTITLRDGVVEIEWRRSKYSPVTHMMGYSTFTQKFNLKDSLEPSIEMNIRKD